VVSPVSSRESWTVVGDDDRTVEPVELYLAYLTGVERSPNTVKAYAHDLKDWFEFLADRELVGLAVSGFRGYRGIRCLAAHAGAGARRAGGGTAVGGAGLQ
jgi:hypothetical protein